MTKDEALKLLRLLREVQHGLAVLEKDGTTSQAARERFRNTRMICFDQEYRIARALTEERKGEG